MSACVNTCLRILESQQVAEVSSLGQKTGVSLINHPVWFWLFFIQLLIILVLVHFLLQKKINEDFAQISKDKVKAFRETEVDLDNVVNSINEAETLYKELSRKYHPDRFLGDSRHEIAESLFQQISAKKRNFSALQKLKAEAEKKLS